MRKLFVATGNRDKLREIRVILGDSVEVVSLSDVNPYPEPAETGGTLLLNALIKAREGYARTGLPSIADDTGLEVEALGGAPGVFSARYAGENASYQDNVRKLLEELGSRPSDERSATFRCVMALVDGKRELWWEGVAEGVILFEPKGANGFGYDPVFFSNDLKKSFAEANADEKNRVSHRGRALQSLVSQAQHLLSNIK